MIVYDKTGFVNVDNIFSATFYASMNSLSFSYRGGSTSFTYDCQADAEKDIEELMNAYRNGYKVFQMKNSVEYKKFMRGSQGPQGIGKIVSNIENITRENI